jgi:hypothetical protein
MIKPLTHLQELTLSSFKINNTFTNRSYKEFIQLPSTLKKLSLDVSLIDNPELFVRTINSHHNIIEFSYFSDTNELLEPFYKLYSSLVSFEYTNQQLQSPQHLIKVFEQNSQIATFKLSLRYWNNENINYISNYFSNLDKLHLTDYNFGSHGYPDINLKLSQPTKIKKLKLEQIRLSDYSLSSILINCPHLEESSLTPYVDYKQFKSISFINPYISTKIRILNINCDYLSERVFRSLLMNSPHIKVLNIALPCEWKEAIKSICENCANLMKLSIHPSFEMLGQERDIFYQDFYKTEFFTIKVKFKSTLTHLTLNGFNALDSKSEHFKNFESLKSIKYLPQILFGYNNDYQDTKIDMSLWPGYRLINIICFDGYGAEFKRS